METANFKAMTSTATSKYVQLITSMIGQDESKDNLEKNLKMIHSIYQDEMNLIAELHGIKTERKENKKKVELKIFDFMVKR